MRRTRNRVIRKSYSVAEDLAMILEKEAEDHDLSTSMLLGQFMRKGIYFDLPLTKIGTITITNMCFQTMMEHMGMEDLKAIARQEALGNFGIMLSVFNGMPHMSSVIDTYYKRFSKYSGWYSFNYESNNGTYRLVFEHTRGIKWSKFLEEYNHVILDKLSERIDCHVDNNLVVFDIIPKDG